MALARKGWPWKSDAIDHAGCPLQMLPSLLAMDLDRDSKRVRVHGSFHRHTCLPLGRSREKAEQSYGFVGRRLIIFGSTGCWSKLCRIRKAPYAVFSLRLADGCGI